MNGTIDDCGDTMGATCSFGCIDGFIIDRGVSARTCQANGKWDGAEPHCAGMKQCINNHHFLYTKNSVNPSISLITCCSLSVGLV